MIHLQLRVPPDLTDEVVELLDRDETVTNVAVFPGGYRKPEGTLVLADVARESADELLACLRELDVHHSGSMMTSEPSTLLSDERERVERAAPGAPDDGVVWDVVENHVRKESSLSWAFVVFLTLATLIAGIGRYLDQPILIVGAMVVGPEFSPVAAICLALTRPRWSLIPPALVTLAVGFGIALTVATALWWGGDLVLGVDRKAAAGGPDTEFIVHPDAWSFWVAFLAGIAGVLSLTTSKAGNLVGVFIAVTTVPAAGTIALCLGVGLWSDAWAGVVQLTLNLLGLVVAGTLALLVQKAVWRRVSGRPAGNRVREGRTSP